MENVTTRRPRSTRKSVYTEEDNESYTPKKPNRNRTPSSKALESIASESSPTMKKIEAPRRSMRKKLSLAVIDDENPDNRRKKLKENECIVIGDESFDDHQEKVKEKEYDVIDDDSIESFKSSNEIKNPMKTNNLFEDEDIEGQKIYSFKTPKKRDSMMMLAQCTPKTPRHNDPNKTTPKTPKNNRLSEIQKTPTSRPSASKLTKTPRHVRDEIKKKLNKARLLELESATSKTKTSDHTLDRLKNSRIPHDQLVKLLSNMTLSQEHEQSVKDLHNEHKSYFSKWLTLFDEGFTVILHGLGSKRNLLQSFHKEKLANEHVVVINGFFPSLTIKDILDAIWVDILENSGGSGGSSHDIVYQIEEQMESIPALNIFVIVHNIDGSMLRNDKAQSVLSRLASIRNIHMIVSIDHINAPLLWNNTKLGNYNFVWFDVTSFLPYTEETAFENSLMVQNSGTLELSSMKSVFQSLTTNARGIYIILVKYQLKNSGNLNYQGMSFKELYKTCREAFLVSSDVALRAQLTEFLDHKLARTKRTIEGTENIIIPIRNILLEQFLTDQN
ncbi:CLUMA_CG019072, isoform A [Clunio marinus]|uniref:Origin recognition complex subunit 2 n=1 Tax=Clunio marinus TaxID=568069 RepID=A0A1J1J0W0_9DIPT|nr:CLUMA_CG019072, isoform A [Clunio marinus]